MVRTYAFNPSTQITESLPGAKKREPYPQPIHTVPIHKQSEEIPLPIPLPYLLQMDMHNHSLLDASFSSTSSSSVPLVVEGALKIFGIRTVSIDGQTYYQPINPEIQRLINQQIEQMGIINKSTNSNSPPQDPGPTYDEMTGNQAMLAAMHLAASQSMSQSNSTEVSGSNSDQRILEKQYDSGKNVGGLPIINSNKFSLTAVDHHSTQNQNKENSHEMIDDLPPWTRGNPQPRSGKRGTVDWHFGQRTSPPDVGHIPSTSSLYFNKPAMESQHGSQSLLNSFGSSLARALPLPRQSHPPPADLYRSFASSYDPRNSISPPAVHYPLHASNSYGNFYSDPTTSTEFISPAFKYLNPYHPGHEKFGKEQHKLDLLQQIEDNRRRKEIEKRREWELEERERMRSEIFAARQRAEIEEEQKKQREQALAAERKATRIAETNADFLPKNRTNRASDSRQKQGRRESFASENSTNNGLEWWEKKKTVDETRAKSPVIPTLAQRRNSEQTISAPSSTAIRQTPSPGVPRQRSSSQAPPQSPLRSRGSIGSANQNRSLSRLSRRSYQPSIGSRQTSRMDNSFRNLSATHRQLHEEQKRVKQAIENNEYGHQVFE